MAFPGLDYFLFLSLYMQAWLVPVMSVELKNSVCCLISYFYVLTQPVLPDTCQHGDICGPQLPLFSEKVWDFLVAVWKRQIPSPIQNQNLSVSWFWNTSSQQNCSPTCFFPSFFIAGTKGGKGRRHRPKFYFISVRAVRGKGLVTEAPSSSLPSHT